MLKPDVSVIVCAHNEVFIYDFVKSIQKSIGVKFEVIVISSSDNLSSNGIPGCLVMAGPALPAAKRNVGARLAKGRYLAFFDDDTEIDSACLLHFSAFLDAHKKVGMVYGKLHKGDETTRFDEAGGFLTSTGFIWSRAGQNIVDSGQYDEPEPIFAGKSASCMIRAKLFKELGGFDEEFGILGEESDLSWRVWLSGIQVYYVPSARGLHFFNTRRKDTKLHYTSSRVQFNGCRNYCTMLIKNMEAGNLCKTLPVHVAIWFFAGVVMIGTGKIRQGANILKGLWYVIRNLNCILAKRSIVQSRRSISDRNIWPFIYRKAPKGYYKTRITRYLTLGLHG